MIHEEALYQVYVPLPLPFVLQTTRGIFSTAYEVRPCHRRTCQWCRFFQPTVDCFSTGWLLDPICSRFVPDVELGHYLWPSDPVTQFRVCREKPELHLFQDVRNFLRGFPRRRQLGIKYTFICIRLQTSKPFQRRGRKKLDCRPMTSLTNTNTIRAYGRRPASRWTRKRWKNKNIDSKTKV